MVTWSTDSINERERFSYWREMICRSLFNFSPEALIQDFFARMTARSSGPLRFVMSESTAHQFSTQK
jgi:AraC family transcriptional activator of tynA and feaB